MGNLLAEDRCEGVNAELLAKYRRAIARCPFDVRVGWCGGVRSDPAVQLSLYLAGTSKAEFLEDTPHGHGAAIDGYPQRNGKNVTDENAPEWAVYGAALEAEGLVWGGSWTNFKDRPHAELPGWRALPMPNGSGFVDIALVAAVLLLLLLLLGIL